MFYLLNLGVQNLMVDEQSPLSSEEGGYSQPHILLISLIMELAADFF